MTGIIGGSGIRPEHITQIGEWSRVWSPYGFAEVFMGTLGQTPVQFVSRHGINNAFNPSLLNYRANLSALKLLGCSSVITTSAVGALNPSYSVGDLVILDQFIDMTNRRHTTIYDEGAPQGNEQHTDLYAPYCPTLSDLLFDCAGQKAYNPRRDVTVVTIEGPRFCTKAEARMYALLGADVINMTSSTEAIIANELKLRIATLAVVTDIVGQSYETSFALANLISVRSRNLAPRLGDILGLALANLSIMRATGEAL
jgi:5'-methylthioadenosine phosphorylase